MELLAKAEKPKKGSLSPTSLLKNCPTVSCHKLSKTRWRPSAFHLLGKGHCRLGLVEQTRKDPKELFRPVLTQPDEAKG